MQSQVAEGGQVKGTRIRDWAIRLETHMQASPIRKIFESGNMPPARVSEGAMTDLLENLRIQVRNLEEPLKVVLMGEVKAGKSTFMNAIAGGAGLADRCVGGNCDHH